MTAQSEYLPSVKYLITLAEQHALTSIDIKHINKVKNWVRLREETAEVHEARRKVKVRAETKL